LDLIFDLKQNRLKIDSLTDKFIVDLSISIDSSVILHKPAEPLLFKDGVQMVDFGFQLAQIGQVKGLELGWRVLEFGFQPKRNSEGRSRKRFNEGKEVCSYSMFCLFQNRFSDNGKDLTFTVLSCSGGLQIYKVHL
jgi:hypothetical protein